MFEVSANTVTLTGVECVSDPEVPVTLSVKLEGVTEGPRLTVNVEEADPPLGGVTEVGDADTSTPLGCPDTLRATSELNPLSELRVTVVEPDPPTLTLIGEAGLSEKSSIAIFATKASSHPPKVVWKAPEVAGKSVESVVPVR
jgi:hypothetical protein